MPLKYCNISAIWDRKSLTACLWHSKSVFLLELAESADVASRKAQVDAFNKVCSTSSLQLKMKRGFIGIKYHVRDFVFKVAVMVGCVIVNVMSLFSEG